MFLDQSSRTEWRRGWPVVLGATICAALGIPLFYYVFSIFSVGITSEFGMSRGTLANLQALLVVGALAAPLIGKLLDQRGFAFVFSICTVAVVAGHIAMATSVTNLWAFAAITLVYGVAGVGCGHLSYTRPVNAWFWHSRGLALGVTAIGLAITASVASPLLATLVENRGWRAGFWALAISAGLVALPLTLLLVRNMPPEGPAGPAAKAIGPTDTAALKETDFWLLAGSMFCIAVAGSGLLSQLSPLVQEEGISAKSAAYGVTAYAIGQVIGRIVAGWFLDHADPRRVAFLFTFVPAIGFVMLATMQLPLAAAIVAVGMIGIQQGAEIDLFAFFVARRFGLAHYGSVYGWIVATSWLGNATGVLTFGWIFVARGNYALAELIGAILLAIGALLIALVRIDGPDEPSAPSHTTPEPLQAP